MDNKSIANKLVELRKTKGLTVKNVAEALGVSASTYREWEYGRKISGEPYIELSRIFGVTLEELFGHESTKSKALSHIKVIEIELDKLKDELFIVK